jgi:hypothetical protein
MAMKYRQRLPRRHIFRHEGTAVVRRVWWTTSRTGKAKITDLLRQKQTDSEDAYMIHLNGSGRLAYFEITIGVE